MKKKTQADKIKKQIRDLNLPGTGRLWGGKKGESMKTDLNYIKKLIKLLNASNISEIEVEQEGVKIKVVKNRPALPGESVYTVPAGKSVHTSHTVNPGEQESLPAEEQQTRPEAKSITKKTLIDVRSPIVGTFYLAPSPNADSYVQVGQIVGVGTVMCIIEAMKLMNEIESEVNGKVAEICVENGKPVEYNQVLFRIEPV